MKFNKVCKKCSGSFEGSRNSRFCQSCTAYQPKGERLSSFRIPDSVWKNRSLMSYFMGFCSSDGSVQMALSGVVHHIGYYNTEKQIVDDITSALQYPREPVIVNKIKPKNCPHAKDCWGNLLFSDNARRIGLMGLRKEKTELDFSEMDVDLIPYLAGLFDGDGSINLRKNSTGISISQVDWIGQEKLMNSLALPLGEKLGHLIKVHKQDENLWEFSVGHNDGYRILKEAYSLGNPRLEYKYQDFLKVTNIPSV